jgi:hypothetical protein
VIVSVDPTQIEIREEQRSQRNDVGTNEEPDAESLTSVDLFGRLVMTRGPTMHLAVRL